MDERGEAGVPGNHDREGDARAVILVHYGAPDLTLRCLRSLASRETAPHRVIVVDHGPGPGLEAALEGAHPRLVVLRDHGNPGFGAGCNRGVARALADGARFLWLLNNDALLQEPLLARFEAWAAEAPEVVLWGTRQKDGDRSLGADLQPFSSGAGAAAAGPVLPAGCRCLGERETLSGASILFTREAWERLGPLPEEFFLYLEDTAWCMRAHRLGLPMAIADLEVIHARSSTIGKRSPLAVFYGTRNRLLLERELRPGGGPGRIALGLHMLQKRFFQGRWHLLKPTLRGVWAGLRGRAGRDPRY